MWGYSHALFKETLLWSLYRSLMSERLHHEIEILLSIGWESILERILKLKTKREVNRSAKKSSNDKFSSSLV